MYIHIHTLHIIQPKYVVDIYFRFPEGRSHLFSLLTLALPGIDPNDFRKTLVSYYVMYMCTYIYMYMCVYAK